MVEKFNKIQQLNAEQQARTNFVSAASGLRMADGQSQDPMRAQVRFRNGDMVYVKDLPVIDRKNPQPNGDYVVALVADHEGKVKVQAGGLWLFVENGKLHALVLWSKNKVAADLKPLADDRVLQFSTEGYVDEIAEDGTYGDFWVHTLSPVTVGNDPGTEVLNQSDGRILVTNAITFDTKGENIMSKKTLNELTPEERESLKEELKGELKAEIIEELTVEETVENELEETKEGSEETTETTEQKEEETTVRNKVSTTPKAPIANARPTQPTVRVGSDGHREEMVAFSNAIAQATRNKSGEAGVRAAMDVYNSSKKNVISGDAFVPTSLVTAFFKAWVDNEKTKFINFRNARAGAVYAASTSDTALDHTKGDPTAAKVDQELALTRRDLKALAVYKRLPIDAQDLFDDHNGDLIKFRTQELSARIANQIIVAAVLGGNTPGSVGSTNGGGTRGLFGIVPDAAAVSGFGTKVASEVQGTNGEDKYAAAIKTVNAIVTTSGGNITSAGLASTGITLAVPTTWIGELLLTKNSLGNYQFTRDVLQSIFGASSFLEMPELNATGNIIAIADGAYHLVGENSPKLYPRFDDEYNQDVLLAEQFVAGSLAGYKQAAVYVPYDAS